MKKAFAIAGAVLLCGVVVWFQIKERPPPEHPIASPPAETYSIPKHAQYSFTVQNRTNRLLRGAEIWVFGPVRQNGTQKCNLLKASHPYKLSVDDLGNQVLHFTFREPAPFGSEIITIAADLLMSDEPIRGGELDHEKFLRPEPFVESEDPDIVKKAQELNGSSPFETAERIFNWVAGHVQYAGYVSKERGALYALKHKKGDCTEFMYLFAALCRANGIPVRCMGGYVLKDSGVLKPSAYHNWAEFYDNGVWKLADPKKRVFADKHGEYLAMNILSGFSENPLGEFHRFRFAGQVLKVKMNS